MSRHYSHLRDQDDLYHPSNQPQSKKEGNPMDLNKTQTRAARIQAEFEKFSDNPLLNLAFGLSEATGEGIQVEQVRSLMYASFEAGAITGAQILGEEITSEMNTIVPTATEE